MSELPATALREALPTLDGEWLKQRRWFSSKGQTLASLDVGDWGVLPLPEPGIVAIVRIDYSSGRAEQYLLPLIASDTAQPKGARTPPAAELRHAGATWYVHDAFQFESFQRLLMELLIRAQPLPLEGGRLIFAPEPALRQSPPPLAEIRLVTAEQSNSSIIYDRQAILKCFRRVVAGVNPDVEVSRFLGRVGFRHTPGMLGSITYTAHTGTEHSLGLLQGFVPNQGDAWEHTLQQLAAFLSAAQEQRSAERDIAATTRELAAIQFDEMRTLGRLTGEMHRALASDDHDRDFAPRPLTSEQVAGWQASIQRQADDALNSLSQRAQDLPEEQRWAVAALLAAHPRIDQRIQSLQSLARSGLLVTRYHGDYHLGQVLVSERGFLILDFEGEPLRSLEERRAHSSPLKDVAGMLRSLSYASQAALRAVQGGGALAAWAGAWESSAREAFLEGYGETTEGAAFIPTGNGRMESMLAVFELEKALYELNYELNNRPDWLPIPLAGIQRTL